MKQKIYTKKEYEIVIKLRKKGMSPKKIIEICKERYKIKLKRSIEHWIYNNVKPRDLKRPLKEGYNKLTSNKAYILGVLCGDGCIDLKKPRILLGVTSKEFSERFIDSVKVQYGLNPCVRIIYKEKIKPSRIKIPDHIIIAKKDQIHVTFHGRNLVSDLKKYGDFRTNNWKVPNEIMNTSDKNIICSFLQGIYDSEGNATHHISLSSNSLKGLNEVKYLLEKLKIQSSIRQGRTCFILSIYNQRNKILFKNLIGFTVCSRKKQLEITLNKYKTKKSYSKKYVNELIPQILKFREKGFSSREIAKKLSIGKSTVLRKLNGLNKNLNIPKCGTKMTRA